MTGPAAAWAEQLPHPQASRPRLHLPEPKAPLPFRSVAGQQEHCFEEPGSEAEVRCSPAALSICLDFPAVQSVVA